MLKCELCGSSEKVFAHLHYEEHYKYPRFMVVCRRCHRRIHRKLKMNKRVIIWVDEETREMLKSLGRKGETYNDIIKRLISSLKEKKEEAKAEAEPDNIKFNFEG